jgi:succinylglutamate desuccinylase
MPPRIVWLALWAMVMVSATSSFHSSSSSSNNNNNPYQFNKKVEKIVIVGGTHGNEYTGIWCVQAWETTNPSARYPSLSIQTLIGNPEAHRLNRRFVDNDLNREFTSHRLVSQCVVKDNNVDNNNDNDMDTTTTTTTTTTTAATNLLVGTVESRRAHELNQLLGPKSKPTQDLIIDLHTTTANMGTTLIIPAGDTFLAKVVSYVQSQLPHVRILVHNVPNRDDRPNLGSMARHGLTIEVGPVPQGVLRHDAVEATQQALMSVLDYCELHHHHQKQKNKPLLEGKRYIPCFRSAPAQRPGDLSGKIAWPTCPTNPNFPLYMIHSSLQDQDYSLLRTGDPLFVKLDGTIIPYDGSHGSPVHILFVNEGGYYYSSSGTGIGVAVAATLDCHTGNFVSKEVL